MMQSRFPVGVQCTLFVWRETFESRIHLLIIHNGRMSVLDAEGVGDRKRRHQLKERLPFSIPAL
jgi:hypothetical protein